MSRKINLTSNNGLGWSFGDNGLRNVEFATEHEFAWDVSKSIIESDTVVTNGGETVTNGGDIVTNGA